MAGCGVVPGVAGSVGLLGVVPVYVARGAWLCGVGGGVPGARHHVVCGVVSCEELGWVLVLG